MFYDLILHIKMQTHRSTGGDGGQQYSTQPSPGCSYQKGGDEDPRGHRQTISPTRQEEISQREQTQSQGVVRSFNGGRDDCWHNQMILKVAPSRSCCTESKVLLGWLWKRLDTLFSGVLKKAVAMELYSPSAQNNWDREKIRLRLQDKKVSDLTGFGLIISAMARKVSKRLFSFTLDWWSRWSLLKRGVCVCVYLQGVVLGVLWPQRLAVVGEVDHGEWHCGRHCSHQHGLHYLQTRAVNIPVMHNHKGFVGLSVDFPGW